MKPEIAAFSIIVEACKKEDSNILRNFSPGSSLLAENGLNEEDWNSLCKILENQGLIEVIQRINQEVPHIKLLRDGFLEVRYEQS